ncbi:hypothetical protein SAMN05444483_1012 [Salegentibacter echinorum]|uniref:DUF4878 domain-containing protein n=1 Tax=Salegentibacter echinorum TaxID=1073325 RepID=A0A1M5BF36_SALEC|nr:hypothetical protein [Salegentibacter echinorum]SHF41038.1 hypothetical protein SAMN05444483_1012 [Salegentibacter echinorum]
MKKFVIYSMILMLISCAEVKNNSPSETAKIVAESFYQGDKESLKAHTTEEGYSNLSSIQDMFVEDANSESNFKVMDEEIEAEVAWIKYSTAYDPKPGVFNLIKKDGKWKVTHNGPREKGPF